MQCNRVYGLEKEIKLINDPDLLNVWSRLQTSDHFYYMSTKYWSDGDVHKYFSPYESPYDAHIYYMNVLSDLEKTIQKSLTPAESLTKSHQSEDSRERNSGQNEKWKQITNQFRHNSLTNALLFKEILRRQI